MDVNRSWGALVGLLWLVLLCGGHDADVDKLQFEAAFQGRCGEKSPCEQLCYELHDGMYECDCKEGFILREDGYSCYEINSTASPPSIEDAGVEDIIYQKDAVIDVLEFSISNTTDSNEIPQYSSKSTTSTANRLNYTTQGPRLEQKLTSDESVFKVTKPISTVKPCPLDCGPGGGCFLENSEEAPSCLCPLGKSGERCDVEKEIHSPRFTGSSWLAFPALRGAYKHVQLSLELRPESYDGIFFLTGERDDMAGDFMALVLHQGFVEFRFDCGSGIGVVRSEETVLLNQWNHITLYRHRWDAWLQLNSGKHVQGRSKGLFSRITFREPLFIGGPGNTTGLTEKLPISRGLKGCIRHLEVNDHAYKFALEPAGEAMKGYGIEECRADRCSHVPCQHGGKCLTSDNSAVCLCPLGFSGDLCEIRVDLQVPSFNGSSHLRYRGLAESALTWLDFDITFKPTAPDGLMIYNGHRMDGTSDFMGLYLNDGFAEFIYDLGTGSVTARSKYRLALGEWHQVSENLPHGKISSPLGGQPTPGGSSLPRSLYPTISTSESVSGGRSQLRRGVSETESEDRLRGVHSESRNQRETAVDPGRGARGRQRRQLPAPLRSAPLRGGRGMLAGDGLLHLQVQTRLQRPPVFTRAPLLPRRQQLHTPERRFDLGRDIFRPSRSQRAVQIVFADGPSSLRVCRRRFPHVGPRKRSIGLAVQHEGARRGDQGGTQHYHGPRWAVAQGESCEGRPLGPLDSGQRPRGHATIGGNRPAPSTSARRRRPLHRRYAAGPLTHPHQIQDRHQGLRGRPGDQHGLPPAADQPLRRRVQHRPVRSMRATGRAGTKSQ